MKTILKQTEIWWMLLKDNEVFCEFADNGGVKTTPFADIFFKPCWFESSHKRIADLLIKYEKRLIGFQPVAVRIKTRREADIVSNREAERIDRLETLKKLKEVSS